MLSFLTQSAGSAPSAGAAAASAMFDDELFASRTRAAFPSFAHHGTAPPHFPFGGFPVHHDPFGSEYSYFSHFDPILNDLMYSAECRISMRNVILDPNPNFNYTSNPNP